MGKYEALTNYLLSHCDQTSVSLTFQQINTILSPNSLSFSAYTYREWWANDGYHSQAKSWYKANFFVEAVNRNTVVFHNCDSSRKPKNQFTSNNNIVSTVTCPFCKLNFERSKIYTHIKYDESKKFGSTIYFATSKFICNICGHIINDFSEENISFHRNRKCKK